MTTSQQLERQTPMLGNASRSFFDGTSCHTIAFAAIRHQFTLLATLGYTTVESGRTTAPDVIRAISIRLCPIM